MSQALRKQISDLRDVLSVVESQLALEIAIPDGMQDLAATVDGLRASVWIVLKTEYGDDERQLLSKMRIRRATEICETVLEDLDGGAISSDTPGFSVFRATAHELLQVLPGGAS